MNKERDEAIKEMIQREIQSIHALDERLAFKDMIEHVFLSLYEKNQEMYEALEGRVMDELSYDREHYTICTGIIEREYYDSSHNSLRAVCEEDVYFPAKFSIKRLREVLEEDGEVRIGTVFFKCDSLQIEKLLENKEYVAELSIRRVEGNLQSSEDVGEREVDGMHEIDRKNDETISVVATESKKTKSQSNYKVKVALTRSTRYFNKVEKLYKVFIKNGIPWNTVNLAYFYKMLDVTITELPEELSDKDVIEDFHIELGEYNSFSYYHMIPLWNIEEIEMPSVGFPISIASKLYEHRIQLDSYGEDNAYLVDSEDLQSIRRDRGSLYISSQSEKAEKWQIYTIRNGERNRIDRFTYPLLNNTRKDVFSDRIRKHFGQQIKTVSELKRMILGLGLDGYVAFRDYEIVDRKAVFDRRSSSASAVMSPYLEKYNAHIQSMNFFIEDEIRDRDASKCLLLKFSPVGSEEWLLRDMLLFITTEVQEYYPEYQCLGVFV